MCSVAQLASGDTSVTPVFDMLSVCSAPALARADTPLNFGLPERSSVCKTAQPDSAETSMTLVWQRVSVCSVAKPDSDDIPII